MYGAFVIDSIPPVTTTSTSPARIIESAISIARIDDAQTLLIVSAGVSTGSPAPTAAWRAGAWPAPPWSTCPMITYSGSVGSIPTRSSAARIANAPSSVARCCLRPPPRRPKGVRTAAMMTVLAMPRAYRAGMRQRTVERDVWPVLGELGFELFAPHAAWRHWDGGVDALHVVWERGAARPRRTARALGRAVPRDARVRARPEPRRRARPRALARRRRPGGAARRPARQGAACGPVARRPPPAARGARRAVAAHPLAPAPGLDRLARGDRLPRSRDRRLRRRPPAPAAAPARARARGGAARPAR